MLGRQERDLSLVTGLWPGFVTYPDASGCVHIEMSGHDGLKTLLQVGFFGLSVRPAQSDEHHVHIARIAPGAFRMV